MPASFLGHGNPMNTLADNELHPVVGGVRCQRAPAPGDPGVSAHWFINASAVTAMAQPRTIHDFFGFPDELFAVEYPAPGAPDIADEVAEAVKPMWVGLDHDSWGLDHGTWSVLVHAFPAADIPVIQLSIDASKPIEHHLQLGAAPGPAARAGHPGDRQRQHRAQPAHGRLRPSRAGLRLGAPLRRGRPRDPHHRSRARSPSCSSTLTTAGPCPTPDHFFPMVYLAGLAAASGSSLDVLIDGYDAGSLSMTSYTLGEGPAPPVRSRRRGGAPPHRRPAGVHQPLIA